MECLIIYFSLTESTAKIARAIYKGVTSSGVHCEILPLKLVDIQVLEKYDLIGLGSPVWRAVPRNVEIFIGSMPLSQGRHIFTFSTHGAKPDRFFPKIFELLTEKEMTIIGHRDWYGSVNLPNLPKPYFTDDHPDATDLKEAEDYGKEMVKLSLRISAGETDLIPSPPEPLPQSAYRPSRPRIPIELNSQKCQYPECRLCMDHCPMGAIDLSLSPPVFGKGCEYCYFCEMICPEGAIEVDYEKVLNMGISRAKNVFTKELDKAEAEGRFRPLVAREDVGWDTPYFKLHNRHPRYIVPEDGSKD
ncbi:hypothetical protein ACFLZG_05470 [Thermodesulfobacteriota bacterium]